MRIEILPGGSRITLPSGEVVLGVPHDTEAYRATARQLGYGDDTLAMCRDHDPLHALLAAWLGLEVSYALLDAAGRSRRVAGPRGELRTRRPEGTRVRPGADRLRRG